MRPLHLLAAAAIAALHLNAQASLLHPAEFATTTQTWLKLSETAGLSMTEFNGGVGGWNAKYRLATSDEIARVLGRLGLVEGDSGWAPQVPAVGAFIDTLGGSAPGPGFPYAGTWGSNGNFGANGVGLGWSVTAMLNNGDHPMALSASCPAYTNCGRIIVTQGFGSTLGGGENGTGLFLVRIPEPSSVALFGLASGLLAIQRRRKRT